MPTKTAVKKDKKVKAPAKATKKTKKEEPVEEESARRVGFGIAKIVD